MYGKLILSLIFTLFLALAGCGQDEKSNQEIETHRSAVNIAASCGSDAVLVGGYCWYLAAMPKDAGPGPSCVQVCNSRGGVNREGQDIYAGYRGRPENCQKVADAFISAKKIKALSGLPIKTYREPIPCGIYFSFGIARHLMRSQQSAMVGYYRGSNYGLFQQSLFCACNR